LKGIDILVNKFNSVTFKKYLGIFSRGNVGSGFLPWLLIILMLFAVSVFMNPARSAETVLLEADSQRAGKNDENGVVGQSLPARPKPEKLINNLSKEFPNFLKAEEASALEEKLRKFNLESSNQICILIIDSLSGLDENDFSTQLFNKWGIGQGDKDNGLLILIKPTQKEGGRKVYINVGYGLEASVTDLAAKQVIEKIIIPNFKAGNIYQALDEATTVLMKQAQGEFNDKLTAKTNKSPLIFLVFLIPFFFILFSELFLSRTGEQVDISKRGSRGVSPFSYLPFFIPGPFSNHNSFGSNHSSGSGFGGFSSFGGFGGGSSGGGGAGGSW
jgi:uncharacterized protein